MMLVCIKQHQATFQAQFMKKLSNTGAELKKSDAYKKACFFLHTSAIFNNFIDLWD